VRLDKLAIDRAVHEQHRGMSPRCSRLQLKNRSEEGGGAGDAGEVHDAGGGVLAAARMTSHEE
jgi:hypothetical protein